MSRLNSVVSRIQVCAFCFRFFRFLRFTCPACNTELHGRDSTYRVRNLRNRRFDIEEWIVGDRDFVGFPYSHLLCCEWTRPFGCSEEIRRHCGHGPPLGSEMAAIMTWPLLDAMPCRKESYIVWNSLGCTWASTASKPWIMKSPGKRLSCQLFFWISHFFADFYGVYMMYMQNMFWVMCGFRFWVWSFTTFWCRLMQL